MTKLKTKSALSYFGSDSEVAGHSTYLHAWAFWAQCWIGRKGKGGTKNQGGLPSVRRTANGGSNASRLRAAANDLTSWATQFELMPKIADDPQCGVYCDPPWVGAGRNYLHSFDEQSHRDLETCLRRFDSTTVVVRYGDDPLIRALYHDWRVIESSSRNQHNVKDHRATEEIL